MRFAIALAMSVAAALSLSTENVALFSQRRAAALHRYSSARDAVSERLAGEMVMKDVEKELADVAEKYGMRSVYNVLEAPVVTARWQGNRLHGFEQIVLLNSGFDARAYTRPFAGKTVYEVDAPRVNLVKGFELAGIEPRARVRRVHCDVNADGIDNVFRKLHDAGWTVGSRTAFVFGGYDQTADRAGVLEGISNALSGGCVLFETGKMLDDGARVHNFLKRLSFAEIEMARLSDPTVSARALFPSEPLFRHRWLVHARY